MQMRSNENLPYSKKGYCSQDAESYENYDVSFEHHVSWIEHYHAAGGALQEQFGKFWGV